MHVHSAIQDLYEFNEDRISSSNSSCETTELCLVIYIIYILLHVSPGYIQVFKWENSVNTLKNYASLRNNIMFTQLKVRYMLWLYFWSCSKKKQNGFNLDCIISGLNFHNIWEACFGEQNKRKESWELFNYINWNKRKNHKQRHFRLILSWHL